MDAIQIEAKLLELGFYIESINKIEHGQQLRLGVGAVINIYDNGTVLVQGKLKPKYRRSIWTLRRELPPLTRWHVN